MEKPMNTKKDWKKGVIAVAAGVAILLGGSTYALWSDTGVISADNITSGDLDLTVLPLSYYDVSADRTDVTDLKDASSDSLAFIAADAEAMEQQASTVHARATSTGVLQGHAIATLPSWLIVPGDTVAVVAPAAVTLEGDNLVAELKLEEKGVVATAAANNVTLAVAVFDKDGKQVGNSVQLTAGTMSLARFQAPQAGQGAGTPDHDSTTTTELPSVINDGTADVTVVVFAYFDSTTENMDKTDVTTALTGMELRLDQVRGADANTDNFDDGE